MPIVEVRDLRKHYGDVKAVDGLSFEVEPGEVFGMLGPNGAGKSTTVEIVEGLREMDAGHVRILDLDPHRDRVKVRESIGIQLQSASLFDKLTAREHLALFSSFYSRTRTVDELIELVDLADRQNAVSKELSGGQRQRLSFALAMVNDPEVVFLDEPTTGLDPQARRHMWDVVAAMGKEGKTVFLTTHYMEEAELLCDRIAIIDHGKIIALDTPARLIESNFQAQTVSFDTAHGSLSTTELESLSGVTQAVADDGHVELFTADVAATIGALMDYARQQDVPMSDLNIGQANLEDVFLKLTGRRIRD
ncbi:MAG: ABC transporter ATP-binding protein [Chloroflexi bacterium]|nr:ABC transporter ATP-binding protein [Chloroflexota bacterium]MCY3938290.1 ABC transporter ATP-binding protein [Chloroflexota bacterium]